MVIALVWKSKYQDPLHVLIPLEHNVKGHGVPIRLRWLAQHMRQRGIEPAHGPDGQVELQYVEQGRVVLRKTLAITSSDLAAALGDHGVLSMPINHWPDPLVVRIHDPSHALKPAERNYLAARATVVLARHGVPVVVRGHDFEALREQQARAHTPSFSDSLAPAPNQMIGATVLLHPVVYEPHAGRRVLRLEIIDITTGALLAQISVGGHEQQWTFLVDSVLMQWEAVLRTIVERRKAS